MASHGAKSIAATLLAVFCFLPDFTQRAAAQPQTLSARELRQRLKHDDEDVRRRAALGLGEIGPGAKLAVPQLIATLKDPQPRVREAVIWALGQLGEHSRDAVGPLLELCRQDVRLENRHEAVKALGNIGPPARDAVELLQHVARGGRGERGERPFLPARKLRPLVENTRLRADAIIALGRIKDRGSVNFLVGMLDASRPHVPFGHGAPYHIAASGALAEIGVLNDRVAAALRRGSRIADRGDTSRKVREAAAAALDKLEKLEQEKRAAQPDAAGRPVPGKKLPAAPPQP